MSLNLLDTSNWLPLDGLAPGFDANKAPTVQDLAGQQFSVSGDGGPMTFSFDDEEVQWAAASHAGTSTYEAFLVAEELYYAQWQSPQDPELAVSLVLDLLHGRALYIGATLGRATPSSVAVHHDFRPGTLDGYRATGTEISESRALIGRRVEWVYSETHAYEHIYLSPTWYTWQCLAGPERGLADTDSNTVFQVRPGIFVFTWREKVIPCGSVTVADHRDPNAIRSHGSLFGWDEAGREPVHFTFGAHGRLISITQHSPELNPALDPAMRD
ncbi:molybdenum cofactor biosynthesis protein MoaF [Paenarthrobacter nitroguajacolicus]|uniref:MoaF C-terminal domain-containing protein n=1 Tax=Paenarthrobacter nitroguajacolicus TaxID=211146 RepID=UPI0015BDF6D1|nr:MoaF C-terminal domain-containing protein [Paenarthrobacter nitroguajacolicus]NWL13152.1 molybdenum cofactor biosynthesis protein MoaF [Paenarthrobacter nitroguajacolicus]